MPIRRGDGTALAPKGFAEVRKGDGTVIYSAGPDIVDSYEDADMAEYTHHVTTWTASTDQAVDGAYSGRTHHDTNNPQAVSTTGLPVYPSAGDTFRWHARTDVWGILQLRFATQSESYNADSYIANFQGRDGKLEISKLSGGSGTVLGSTTASYSTNTWYEGEVQWGTGGTMTVTLFDDQGTQIAQVSGTDTDYTSGGVGWAVISPSTDTGLYAHFDYLRIL